MRINALDDLKRIAREGSRLLFPEKGKIAVGMATCGQASGAEDVLKVIQDEAAKRNLGFTVTTTGCLGICQKEPLVDITKPGWPRIVYSEVNPEKALRIIEALADNKVIPDYAMCKMEEEYNLIEDTVHKYSFNGLPEGIKNIPCYHEVPFFKKQQKRVLRNCGTINPDKIEEYIGRGGYLSAFKALRELGPEKIIDEVTKSGLRGRGGAGFPTGTKWKFCRQAKGEPKYAICNADEGDPGAYMDRSILESDPHGVIEGMIIGAYAIGAECGIIYVRAEYPLAIEKFNTALEQAHKFGLLGKDILSSGFDFDIEIERGSGAFVCGEETALIASVEGGTGEPSQRPPFPAQKGVWAKPTNINNVKTWANIPLIISRGADWFSQIGTEKSKGTMIFSMVGMVNNTGLIEVPMGLTLRELVFDIGGGILNKRHIKAVQTGGPSGGCLPASLLDLPVDYEKLAEAGSIMGSGGMVVIMDEQNCMVNVAKYFLTFTKDESCGKCTPCREGIRRMLEILTDITEGRGKEGDIEMLEDMGKTIIDGALCALGGTAPKPVLSTIRYFRDEYEAHIKYKRCPAAVCRKIISSACQHICPLGTDVPAYIALIAKGQFAEAAQAIRKTNPLPSICARVCHHPCESNCAAGETGESIAIEALKRFAMDYERRTGKIVPLTAPKVQYEKVAIVGAGPAGLTCAYTLAQQGYDVTIFEEASKPGGMLALTIPEYRLPSEILNLDIDAIIKSGVKIKTGIRLGKDITINDIFQQGYKAVFLAFGAYKSLKLGIPGEDMLGVVDPLELLKKVKLGEKAEIGEKIGIVGGGNAAIDAARTALRLGAKSVHILYRRTRMEMPANPEEIEEAINEGIKIEYLTAPTKVISTNGKLSGIECIRMKLGEFDKSGRRRPVPIENSEFTVDLDSLIPAIGQQPDTSFLGNGDGIKISKDGTIQTHPETLSTDREGVFAGGDAVTGPGTVTEAMAAGKVAAGSIHRYLRGIPQERKYQVTKPSLEVEPLKFSDEEVEKIAEMPRAKPPELPVEQRRTGFAEVVGCLSEQAAMAEAKRCLRCDLQNSSSHK